MKVRVCVLAAAAAVAVASPARAQQDARCSDPAVVGVGLEGGDACQKVVDLYRYMGVQLGTLVAGGNATLAQGGAMGGLGHFAIGVRANAMRAGIPDVERTGVGIGPAVSSDIPVNDKWAALPVVDASIGIFKGIPLGITNVGGIDALVSVAYLPDVSSGSVKVSTPDGALKFGYGARLGILQETALVPGVSLTWIRRDLPKTTVTAVASPTRSVTIQDLEAKTTAWRLVASKNLLVFGFAAGVGQDKYDTRAALTYDVDGNTPSGGPFALDVSPTRTNVFGDLSLNLAVIKIVGELGRVSGGDVTTFNTFDKGASDPRWYGSVGVRVGF
ncbi:MAG TPA: hypothetical protein VFS44_04385 [Gemmatimonadaceae bacterium]|nr:hypothetical protein [Gemmatimonadaceae bacterium]